MPRTLFKAPMLPVKKKTSPLITVSLPQVRKSGISVLSKPEKVKAINVFELEKNLNDLKQVVVDEPMVSEDSTLINEVVSDEDMLSDLSDCEQAQPASLPIIEEKINNSSLSDKHEDEEMVNEISNLTKKDEDEIMLSDLSDCEQDQQEVSSLPAENKKISAVPMNLDDEEEKAASQLLDQVNVNRDAVLQPIFVSCESVKTEDPGNSDEHMNRVIKEEVKKNNTSPFSSASAAINAKELMLKPALPVVKETVKRSKKQTKFDKPPPPRTRSPTPRRSKLKPVAKPVTSESESESEDSSSASDTEQKDVINKKPINKPKPKPKKNLIVKKKAARKPPKPKGKPRANKIQNNILSVPKKEILAKSKDLGFTTYFECYSKLIQVLHNVAPKRTLNIVHSEWQKQSVDDKKPFREWEQRGNRRLEDSDADSESEEGKKRNPAPQMPRSALKLFAIKNKERVKRESFEQMSTKDLQNKLKTMWKEMSPEDKEPYVTESKKEQLAYNKYNKAATKSAKRKKKDPNAPKRPLSSYILFCQAMKQDNPDKKFDMKEMGRQWNELSPEDKQPFETKAVKAREDYNKLKAAYDESNGGPSKKKQKTGPKKPLTTYFRFMADRMPAMKLENKDEAHSERLKRLGTEWAELSVEKKKTYQDAFDEDMKIYRQKIKDTAEEAASVSSTLPSTVDPVPEETSMLNETVAQIAHDDEDDADIEALALAMALESQEEE